MTPAGRVAELLSRLEVEAARTPATPSPGDREALPPPVRRYLGRVLPQGVARPEGLLRFHQAGSLRTDPSATRWYPFTARQWVSPRLPGFVWEARVDLPLRLHLQVIDSYLAGSASGAVRLLSLLTVARLAGDPELASGALHRYLAEAVWYPWVLLPGSGVVWQPLDDRRARADLTDHGTTVSLEFRFNDRDEVASIYTAGRMGRFGGGYRRLPWEGRFGDYRQVAGVWLPGYGEVGWVVDRRLERVWKGRVTPREGWGITPRSGSAPASAR